LPKDDPAITFKPQLAEKFDKHKYIPVVQIEDE
jgi:hypothetical protein